jgi:hypothetical protein
MAKFERLTPEATTRGAGRIATTATVIATGSQPADIPNILNTTTWDFVSPFVDRGGTNGGIKLVKGSTETEYTADQSDGPYATEVTANSFVINTSLIQVADLANVRQAWAIEDAITVDGVTGTRRLNIAPVTEFPERSVAVAEVYKVAGSPPTYLARCFFIGRVANVAGDVEYNIAKGAQREMAFNLRAFADYSFGYGYILEADGFGGIDNP